MMAQCIKKSFEHVYEMKQTFDLFSFNNFLFSIGAAVRALVSRLLIPIDGVACKRGKNAICQRNPRIHALTYYQNTVCRRKLQIQIYYDEALSEKD